MKVNTNGLCHMTKMAAVSIYSKMVKTFKHLLLWNQNADDVETWYVALVIRVLPNLFK